MQMHVCMCLTLCDWVYVSLSLYVAVSLHLSSPHTQNPQKHSRIKLSSLPRQCLWSRWITCAYQWVCCRYIHVRVYLVCACLSVRACLSVCIFLFCLLCVCTRICVYMRVYVRVCVSVCLCAPQLLALPAPSSPAAWPPCLASQVLQQDSICQMAETKLILCFGWQETRSQDMLVGYYGNKGNKVTYQEQCNKASGLLWLLSLWTGF